jgi:hypothetical protein
MSGIKETKPLSEIDPEMFKLMQSEYDRQIGGLELIASEVSSYREGTGVPTKSAPRRVPPAALTPRLARAELHLHRRHGVPGQLLHKQVLRG